MSKSSKLHNEDKLVKKALEIGGKMAKLQGFDLPQSPQPLRVKAIYLFWSMLNRSRHYRKAS